MLGMAENIMNLSDNKQCQLLDTIHAKSFNLMGNLHQMREFRVDKEHIDQMEPLMRQMEQVMIHLDHQDERHKVMMNNLMDYMFSLQSNVLSNIFK
jgi:hypothetical protein